MVKYLRPFIFLVALCSNAFTVLGQVVIEGEVKDSGGSPLEFVNVALLQPQDSAVLAGAVSDENGQYRLSYSSAGNFLLKVSFNRVPISI